MVSFEKIGKPITDSKAKRKHNIVLVKGDGKTNTAYKGVAFKRGNRYNTRFSNKGVTVQVKSNASDKAIIEALIEAHEEEIALLRKMA